MIDASVAGDAAQPWLAQHVPAARGILEEIGAQALLDRWSRLSPAQAPASGETRSAPTAQRTDARTHR